VEMTWEIGVLKKENGMSRGWSSEKRKFKLVEKFVY
jgi:hypothetical protein